MLFLTEKYQNANPSASIAIIKVYMKKARYHSMFRKPQGNFSSGTKELFHLQQTYCKQNLIETYCPIGCQVVFISWKSMIK